MAPRHKYGTLALIFAVISLFLAIISMGATWATVDEKSTNPFQEVLIDIAIAGDLQLRELDAEVEFKVVDAENPNAPALAEQTYKDTESYKEIAEQSTGDVSTTFEKLDSAGYVAQLMLWIGIIAMLLAVVFGILSLAQITNSRFTTYSGAIGTFFLLFAPIIWYILLPKDGTYTNLELLEDFFFVDNDNFMVSFDPSPSTGLFLSLLACIASFATMFMIYQHNISEVVKEKPAWMMKILNFKLNGEETASQPIDFGEKKEQAKLLLQNSLNAYKSSRIMQGLSLLIILIIVSIPLYSILFKEVEEANAYQRNLIYVVDYDSEYIDWFSGTEELSDGESMSFSYTEADFPTVAQNRSIVGIRFSVVVLDSVSEDNEQTNGVGCLANPGQDAPDSVVFDYSIPTDSDSSQIQADYDNTIDFLEWPGTGPYTGYTISEIEDMYDTSEQIQGNYEFQYTASAEAGSSTVECDRTDSSVTVQYAAGLYGIEIEVIEVGAGEFSEGDDDV